jgi:transposase
VISGIVHVLKSGGRWIDAPPDYGPRKTLYNRYVRWTAKGVWIDLFHALASADGPPALRPSGPGAHRLFRREGAPLGLGRKRGE